MSAQAINPNRLPVLFIGHGSPMNAIEDNAFTRGWHELATRFADPSFEALSHSHSLYPHPMAILMISAHLFTNGTRIMGNEQPHMIYDMYGFPRALYQIQYPAPGAPALAESLLATLPIAHLDTTWGFDHGGWSVLVHLFPAADIPVLQLSVDATATPAAKYAIGQALKPLRDQGVLIIGSGNIVHNLGRVRFDLEGGMPWAVKFDAAIKQAIIDRRFADVMQYESLTGARLAVPTTDHFDPLLYVLGAADEHEKVAIANDACVFGSLSMTCYLIGD